MGTHPIFESDFDCLTDDNGRGALNWVGGSNLDIERGQKPPTSLRVHWK